MLRPQFVRRSAVVASASLLGILAGTGLAQPVLIDTTDVTLNPGTTTIVDQATAAVVPLATAQITVRGRTLTVNGRYSIASLSVERNGANNSGVVTHSPGFSFDYSGGAGTDVVNGMFLNISGNLSVQGASGGQVLSGIDVIGRGFPGSTGPGAGADSNNGGIGGAGGGHGGSGVAAVSFPSGQSYDSMLQPVMFGSGGGSYVGNPAGQGGGCVRLVVGGTCQIDGLLTADGQTPPNSSGSGAGGSIWITAGSLAGSGTISALGAYGGSGYWGPGGGGRIAIYANTTNYTGVMRAWGGTGSSQAAPGPIYTKPAGGRGTLILDNNNAVALAEPTDVPSGTYDVNLFVRSGAQMRPRVGDPSTYTLTGNVTIGNNGVLLPRPANGIFTLTVNGGIDVQAGGRIDTTGLGYAPSTGPGAGGDSNNGGIGGAGGAYGGNGVPAGPFPGGIGYGSVTQPTDMGSGGGAYVNAPGGAGGGSLRLIVGGAVNVAGGILADGAQPPTSSGAGSGGSLWITATSLTGSGIVSANGGNGGSNVWGPGGGGRVAVYADVSGFTGQLSAWGGRNSALAGAGTVWIKPTSARATLTIDNNSGSAIGMPTELPAGTWDSNLLVRAGANMRPRGSASAYTILGTFTLASNSVIGPLAGSNISLNFQGAAAVQAGGSIDATGLGFGPGAGPGAGASSTNGSTGGAGGGYGGNGLSAGPFPGGAGYGSVMQPTDLGSGGGAYVTIVGSAGGGAIRLSAAGSLAIDGSILADGAAAPSAAGAGSGGSIWIDAVALSGSGLISANGGVGGSNVWGSGGGGRIAITSATGTFGGVARAWGGFASAPGGAGTVYTRVGAARANLVLDSNNASTIAAPTELVSGVYDVNLSMAGGAQVRPQVGDSPTLSVLGNFLMQSNTVIGPLYGQSGFFWTIGGNATLQAGSHIDADRRGFGSAQGPGAGTNSNSGSFGGAGAGYGGAGADAGPFLGGQPYGSNVQPTDLGSGGGEYPGAGNSGGTGGGALRMNVGGSLVIDGVVSANGGAGRSPSGAGSGGSVWLTAANVTGAGLVSADGGNSAGNWGAGGGGRIAIYSCNQAGTVTLRAEPGAPGNASASPGTIYTSGSSTVTISSQPVSQHVAKGSTVVMSVSATTSQSGGLTYQWRRADGTGAFYPIANGGRFSGVTTPTLTFTNATCSDSTAYSVLITDSCGPYPSNAAAILVSAIADVCGIGGPPAVPDGLITGDDFIAFINAFAAGDPLADICGIGGPPELPDGLITGDDFVAFINDFATGCP